MELNEKQTRRAMRTVVVAQCVGVHGNLAFQNGLLLLYFLALGIAKVNVIFILSLYGVMVGASVLPAAFLSDRYGKKRVGVVGTALCGVGFLLLSASGFLKSQAVVLGVVGVIVFSIGAGTLNASWYALLKPIVPEAVRGRFFAFLRVSWQLVGIAVSGVVAWMLGSSGSIGTFQIIVFCVALLLFGRTFFYLKIPELNFDPSKRIDFKGDLRDVITINGFASYAAYVFMIFLFTSCCPSYFAMIEKEAMNLDQSTVIWLANLYLVGCLVGFFAGGVAVDRWGTKLVFMICHFGYAVVLGAFLTRGYYAPLTMTVLCASHFSFGFVFASSTIAITSESMSMLPDNNPSLAAGLLRMAQMLGMALSGFASATLLDLGMLKKQWTLIGMTMTDFDSILLINAAMLAMLVVSLGLIPSVVRKAGTYPGGE